MMNKDEDSTETTCCDRHLEIPGMSNNTTGTLEQKKSKQLNPGEPFWPHAYITCLNMLFDMAFDASILIRIGSGFTTGLHAVLVIGTCIVTYDADEKSC